MIRPFNDSSHGQGLRTPSRRQLVGRRGWSGRCDVSVARARQGGDREALDVLFARHIPTLRRWASGRLPRWARDIADTQDLVQETVLQVFKRVEAFEPRGDGALQAYLRQSVMNRIRNEFRSKGRRPSFQELDEQAPGDHTSPLEAAIRQEQLDRYDAALSRLSEPDRDLIVARVEVGLTYEEMAEALGKTFVERGPDGYGSRTPSSGRGTEAWPVANHSST